MTWETLWAVGRFDLRLSEEEFWHMVPRQFAALMERKHLEQVQMEYGPALIVSAMLNALGSKKKPKPSDFMPSWKEETKREMAWQDQLVIVKQLHAAFGGK